MILRERVMQTQVLNCTVSHTVATWCLIKGKISTHMLWSLATEVHRVGQQRCETCFWMAELWGSRISKTGWCVIWTAGNPWGQRECGNLKGRWRRDSVSSSKGDVSLVKDSFNGEITVSCKFSISFLRRFNQQIVCGNWTDTNSLRQGLMGYQEWHGKGLDIQREKEEAVHFGQCMFDRYAQNWQLNSSNILGVIEHCIITHQK